MRFSFLLFDFWNFAIFNFAIFQKTGPSADYFGTAPQAYKRGAPFSKNIKVPRFEKHLKIMPGFFKLYIEKKIGYKTLRRLLQAPVRLNGRAVPTVQVKTRGTWSCVASPGPAPKREYARILGF